MDYETYRKNYFVEPAPEQRFDFKGLYGATLYFQDFERARKYYELVLGPPAYIEGRSTVGWRVGNTWLTLLRGKNGNPQNVEIAFVMQSPEDVGSLRQAFFDAGGSGEPPSDALMYEPIWACAVEDPFGTQILIYSRKGEQ